MIRPTGGSFIGEQLTQLKVIGVGGGGCNAIDRMIAEGIEGVDFIAVNTDLQALRYSQAEVRMRIGDKLTRGLGSGGNPVMGQQAAEENFDDLYDLLQGTDMVFIAAGLGGGTGTGAAPIIAQVARELGILSVGVVTKPFSFEGKHRLRVAEQGIARLREAVDTLIVIPNDRLLNAAARTSSIGEAFAIADSMLRQGIRGISDIVVQRGLINVDFNDVRAIMAQAGSAWMAIGEGSGSNGMVQAVTRAINSPLLEIGIDGARGVLFNVAGDEHLGILEVQEAAEIVAQTVDPEANIMFGAVIDPTIPTGQVRVTLIATGFDPDHAPRRCRRSSAALTALTLAPQPSAASSAFSPSSPASTAAARPRSPDSATPTPALPAPSLTPVALPDHSVEERAAPPLSLAGRGGRRDRLVEHATDHAALPQHTGSGIDPSLELLIPPFLRGRARR